MSRVYGSRVREPRIIKRSVLPSDKKSSSWAGKGKAKSLIYSI